MKKLGKNLKKHRNTIQSFQCGCDCPCPCNYCSVTWISQYNNDDARLRYPADNAILVTA